MMRVCRSGAVVVAVVCLLFGGAALLAQPLPETPSVPASPENPESVFVEGLVDLPPLPEWMPEARPVTIGTVSDGPVERAELRDTLQREIPALLEVTYDVSFPEAYALEGDWTMAGVEAHLDRLLREPKVDIVIAVGLMASANASLRGPLPKPVVAARVVDGELLGLPRDGGASGVRNLVYLTMPAPLRRDLEAFRDLVPFTKVAVLAARELIEGIPAIPANALQATEGLGLDIAVVPVDVSASEALAALPQGTEAVYVAPLLRMPGPEFEALVRGLIERRLPSFSLLGEAEVARGILLSLHPGADDTRLARRVALYVQRILDGEAPERLPVTFPEGGRLSLNMATARAIGYEPTYATLAEANLYQEDAQLALRELTLRGAVETALAANLELAAKQQAVEGGAQNIAAARALLKPHLGASTTGIMIDEDTATPYQPERSWTGSLTLQQLLYDDKVHANLEISRRLQEALRQDYAGLELDITQWAAVAYFNVLRAKTFERIQKNNLRLTRTHLGLSKVRQDVGTAGPGEVYRWESELAGARIEVTNATAMREAAEIDLNRILHLPQEEGFTTQEVGIDDELLLPVREFAVRYLDRPRSFDRFRDFMVRDGLTRSPELVQLDEGIAAQERFLAATKRAYYIPSVGLQAEAKRNLAFGGEGADASPLTGLFMPAPEEDTDWSIGLNASLPLYAGGARKAERLRAERKLEELHLQRSAVQEKIEERIRVAAHKAAASYMNIAGAQERKETARKNLDLVSESYARGRASAIDLLDAQNVALTAELAAAGSIYQFFIDLMELDRAIAYFGFMAGGEERASLRERIDTYFAEGEAAPAAP